jgi:TonB family protein
MKQLLLLPIFLILFLIPCPAQSKPIEVKKHTGPNYPIAARIVRVAGDVIVSVNIDKNGFVTFAETESGHPLLRKVCEDAAKKWKFSAIKENLDRNAKITFTYQPNYIYLPRQYNKKDETPKATQTKIKTEFYKPYQLLVKVTLYSYPSH